MDSTKRRMVMVAVLVCLFAVGMAGLLNFFKYRSTAERIVRERMLVIGNVIDNSIQQSLALGLQFTELNTLAETLERERANDDLILGIDVFDNDGQPLYSTDRTRTSRVVPESWQAAARKAGSSDWVVRDSEDPAIGISVQNNFGLTIGHLALRYSQERVRAAALDVARELALNALMVFVGASLLAAFALSAVMRRLEREVGAVEAALRGGETALSAGAARRGPFATALRRFVDTVRSAEGQIVDLRARLQRGART